MVALLADMRRERNGAVADDMRVYGAPYGLNYGVSLPTVRSIARALPADDDFACYLYLQDIRELRLAALHLADPDRLTPAQFPLWAGGIVNSEVAEEAAFILLSRAQSLPELFDVWSRSEEPLLQYAVLMAAAKGSNLHLAWIETAVDLVHRYAVVEALQVSPVTPEVRRVSSATAAAPAVEAYAARLMAQGAVALLAAYGLQNEENRLAVLRVAGSLGKLPAENFVHEELAWRLSV